MRSTPSSVSFWATHSGRSPLIGAKATVMAGLSRGWLCHRSADLTTAARAESG